MDWLTSLDGSLFRLANLQLSNSIFDWFMPQLASQRFFIPILLLVALAVWFKGGLRGKLFLTFLALAILVGDTFVINTLKHALARPRPIQTLPDVHLLVGRGQSFSMPSSHASSWFAATVIAFAFYRRSAWFFLPFAGLMAFSRVYVGAHYPADVLVGAILGAGYAAAVLWGGQWLWQRAGARWFPEWFRRVPLLLNPPRERWEVTPPTNPRGIPWVGLGYVLIFATLLARLLYLASDKIELSEDEAYQWLWSKHLALSYYSKPPLIAYAQFIGTSLWGDTSFGVRFLSPVLSAVVSFFLLRFTAKVVNPRAGFFLLLISLSTPLLAVGSTLMTVDPLLVTFWSAAMLAGWHATQPEGRTRDWLWAGLWTGLAFLSKYSGLFLLPCWALYFVLWPPARVQLRRPGPYLAIALTLLATLPVVIWNAQNGWITVSHVASNAQLNQRWTPTARHFLEFLGTEAGLLNPVFFAAFVGAMIKLWSTRPRSALEVYFFALGAPVFLGYGAFTLHSRVLPNWIAPSVLPLLVLMVVYWERRWREGLGTVPIWLKAGCSLGLVAVILLHDPNLIRKVTGLDLPQDPLRRVHGWTQTAQVVEAARQQLMSEGKDAFVIASHYGLTGELTFYTKAAQNRGEAPPLIYYLESARPKNQFYFWPHYRYRSQRRGQNALFVQESAKAEPAPRELYRQFESVTDLGVKEIRERGYTLRRLQIFACRNLQ